MSWEAVTWASKQRMKLPHEQLILLVLANCADPDGTAFSRWPGREHWWKYLVDRTRLSKSSLFRHINTLVDLGLCERSTIVLGDGTKRPIISLDLSKRFDIDEFEPDHPHERDQSHGETGEGEGDDDAENLNDSSEVEAEIAGEHSQSHGETSPTGGTAPFPIMGMQKDSLSCSKESPPTPQGGPHTSDDGFEEFKKAWGRPIERLSVAEKVWNHIPTARRGEALAAAKGYFAWIARQRKEPNAILSAQTFLREAAGWAQYLPYAPDGSGVAAASTTAHPCQSEAARAVVTAYEIAGLSNVVRDVMLRNGAVNYRLPITPRLLKLGGDEVPPKDAWPVLSKQQAGAWEGLLRDVITVSVRNRLKEGDRAPWPWPPSVEGKIYTTGPPEVLMTDADVENFK